MAHQGCQNVQIHETGNREVKQTERRGHGGRGIMEVGRRVVGRKDAKVSHCNQDNNNAKGFRDPGTTPQHASGTTMESTCIVYPSVGTALTTMCLPTNKDHRTFDSGADIHSATWDVKP
jgi:hypothetical protein